MDEADPPYVALSDLGCLRLDWPRAIFSFMGHYQVDLEHLRHECRDRFGSVHSGLCTYCGTYTFGKIWADMSPVITWI